MPITLNGTTGIIGPDGSAATPSLVGGDTNTGMFFPAADTVAIATGGTERVRTDSSGNVGIGVTPSAWTTFTAQQIGPTGGMSLYAGADNVNIGANVYYNAGYKRVGAYAASAYQQGAGAHYWLTAPSSTAGSAITFTQAMTLDSSGNLLVGKTSVGSFTTAGIEMNPARSDSNFAVTSTINANYDVCRVVRTAATGIMIGFYNGSSRIGDISIGASSTSYNTSSDYRLKEDVQPMTGALGKVAALKPVTYKWKVDGSAGEGFIAHELQAVVPDCVTGQKDAVGADGNPVYQGIDTSFLVATLTAAIQEQQALITSLTARIAALEGAAQ